MINAGNAIQNLSIECMFMSEALSETPLIYLISPPQIADVKAFARKLDAALTVGGVGAFQLRLKKEAAPEDGRLTHACADDEVIIEAARVLQAICETYGVAFILNDRVDLVKKVNADGVHLGQEDGTVAKARAELGEDYVIGATCHASRHLAMEAGEEGADYVAFGAFFPTSSKTPEALAHWGTPTTEIIEWCSELCEIPSVAIGGITPQNCAPLVRAGADFIAVISAVWNHPESPAACVQEFNDAFALALKPMH
jgi:thiamine-phosphate pyrophosphorylase